MKMRLCGAHVVDLILIPDPNSLLISKKVDVGNRRLKFKVSYPKS